MRRRRARYQQERSIRLDIGERPKDAGASAHVTETVRVVGEDREAAHAEDAPATRAGAGRWSAPSSETIRAR